MVVTSPLALAAIRSFVALARLSPLLPIPPVLTLEWWAASKFEFSKVGLVLFRVAYVVAVVFSVFVTYMLGLSLSEWIRSTIHATIQP